MQHRTKEILKVYRQSYSRNEYFNHNLTKFKYVNYI